MSQKFSLDGLTRVPSKLHKPTAQKKDVNIKFIIIVLIFLTTLFLIGWLLFTLFYPLDKSANPKIFEIKKGASAQEIGSLLKNEDLIRSKYVFLGYALIAGKARNLHEGIYEISASMNIPQILNTISQGETKEAKVTIIEGWRIEEIAQELEEKNLIDAEEFIEALSFNWSEDYEFLKDRPHGAGLEGYLFPDTYFFSPEATGEEIVKEFLDNFDKKINQPMGAEITRNQKTIFDVVIIASIVEREAKKDEDRAKIASVYYNRLKEGLKLEADPTVQYAKGSWASLDNGDYQRIDSSYNTYLYPGLPPGPICSPGLASIEASVNPESTDYLFFFHLNDGTTIFSKTAQEHEEKKIEYKDNGQR